MSRVVIAGSALAIVLGIVVLILGRDPTGPVTEIDLVTARSEGTTIGEVSDYRGFLHGRVLAEGGAVYEGRLRWGGDEEAFWDDYFDGFVEKNPWAEHVSREQLVGETKSTEILGFSIGGGKPEIELGRPFRLRFAEIVRIEPRGRDVRVTLRDGSSVDLDLFSASDFDDGVRIWDRERGIVDLAPGQIDAIELFATAAPLEVPERLHGTVRTSQGAFTGFVQWNRRACVGTDFLEGNSADGPVRIRFDSLLSIARHGDERALVTLIDGRELVLSGTREVGRGHRGIHVEDPRYGRVQVAWDVFERFELEAIGSGPGREDGPPSSALVGSVTTVEGSKFVGRLVFDLDESESAETLDASDRGIGYSIPFGRIASIELAGESEEGGSRARVRLHGGEEVQLERTGDFGEGNAGMLIFTDGMTDPEYVPWPRVARIDFDRSPPADSDAVSSEVADR